MCIYVFIYVFVRTITQNGLDDILHGPTQKPTDFSASCPLEWKAIFLPKKSPNNGHAGEKMAINCHACRTTLKLVNRQTRDGYSKHAVSP